MTVIPKNRGKESLPHRGIKTDNKKERLFA
jgi:hypothetical protein